MPWGDGTWLHPPASVREDGDDLLVTARRGSDLWRTTSYGFVHDDGHALLAPLPDGSACEVTFGVDYAGNFEQAGVLVHADPREWVKAGVEISDGAPQVGAVVTAPVSDWSVAPVPEWAGRTVTVRVSRSGDALTVRARVDDEAFRLVRVAPIRPDAELRAGPYACAPETDGLTVRFTGWRTGPADAALHA